MENREALSWVDQRRPGRREAGFLLLREKRKEEGKMERKKKKERHPNKEALELIDGEQE